ncbi:MAG: GIDE domain-containing protein [Gemmataceae bacterium]
MSLLLGFIGLIALAGGTVLAILAWNNLRAASQLGRPLSRIGKLKPGFRKVRGTIAAADVTLRSPVANKECVYYRLRVYEEKKQWSSPNVSWIPGGSLTFFALGGFGGVFVYRFLEAMEGKADYSWRPLIDDDDWVPLMIEDDTGRVEVDLDGAAVITKDKSRIIADMDHHLPTKLDDLLVEEYELDTVDDRGKFRALHLIEDVLPVGAKATVLGSVEPEEDGALCFQKIGNPLLVSEGDFSKQAQKSRSLAMGYCLGAGFTLAVALFCLVVALVIVVMAIKGKS